LFERLLSKCLNPDTPDFRINRIIKHHSWKSFNPENPGSDKVNLRRVARNHAKFRVPRDLAGANKEGNEFGKTQGECMAENKPKLDFSKEIPGWKGFVEKCKKQAKQDGMEYVPQAEICLKPEFCLVAMEPLKPPTQEETKNGYKAFGNWHINYCAYHYLGKKGFNYHSTDLAKGAAGSTKNADATRKDRYKNWLPLFKKELELLGNPKVIAIGKIVYEYMKKLGFEADGYVLHPAITNCKNLQKEYERIKKESSENFAPSQSEWAEYIKKLMKHCGWSKELIKTREEEIGEEYAGRKKLFTVYGFTFKHLK
jgi:hypothetical protein